MSHSKNLKNLKNLENKIFLALLIYTIFKTKFLNLLRKENADSYIESCVCKSKVEGATDFGICFADSFLKKLNLKKARISNVLYDENLQFVNVQVFGV